MLTFKFRGKSYRGSSALEVVRALERDAEHYPHAGESIRQFLHWSLECLGDRIPPRDRYLSDRMEDGALALSYLYLLDEYGAGKLVTRLQRSSSSAIDVTKVTRA